MQHADDSLSRMTTRTHRGLVDGGGHRPFIERREYLWEDQVLVAEAAYAENGGIRWRKTYLPGAKGMDDSTQLQVETFDPVGRPTPSTTTVFAYLKDEMGTVVALVNENSPDPAKPVTPVRYFYTPYGEQHAETGPELLSVRADASVETVTDAAGAPHGQTVPGSGAAAGALRVVLSLPADPVTFGEGLRLSTLNAGAETVVPAADYAVGIRADRPEELLVLPAGGWTQSARYRLTLGAALRDSVGRSVASPQSVEWDVPATGDVTFSREFPVAFETYLAAGESAGSTLPGGQPMGFQGAYADNITGLQYKRARFYDPRAAEFISEDLAEDRDSVNRQAFVGWKPHRATDPTGRYQADMHRGATYYLALQAGFDPGDARTIAISDEASDANQNLAPMAMAARGEWARVVVNHFPFHPVTGRVEEGVSSAANPTAWSIVESATSLEDLGTGLHLLQDSFSHEGAYAGNFNSEVTKNIPVGRLVILLAQLTGKLSDPEDGTTHDFSPESVEKMGIERGWASVDETHSNPEKAVRAGRASFEALIDFQQRTQLIGCDEAEALKQKWSTIEPEFRKFAEADTIKEKQRWLAKNGAAAIWPGFPIDDLSIPMGSK